jgi:hypothetical protein
MKRIRFSTNLAFAVVEQPVDASGTGMLIPGRCSGGLMTDLFVMFQLTLKLLPDPATRPRQREVFIEFLRKGEADEAVRAFKKLFLEVVHQH